MVKKKVKKQTIKAPAQKTKGLSFWAPRVLMIIYIGLVTSFALDWGKNTQNPQAILIGLIPSIILVIFLSIAWNWEEVGAYLFIALGVIFGVFFQGFSSFTGFSFLVLPIWVIGILFFVSTRIKE